MNKLDYEIMKIANRNAKELEKRKGVKKKDLIDDYDEEVTTEEKVFTGAWIVIMIIVLIITSKFGIWQ